MDEHTRTSSILESFKHNGELVVCLINVRPRFMRYYHGQGQPHRTQRWLHAEHWAKFDAGLESIIDRHDKESVCGSEEIFHIDAAIKVRVRRASLAIASLYDCLGNAGGSQYNPIALSLECYVEYREDDMGYKDEVMSIATDTLQADGHGDADGDADADADGDDADEELEYVPQHVTGDDSNPAIARTNVAYTPAPKATASPKDKTAPKEYELYSPKPIMPADAQADDVNGAPTFPIYNPTKISGKPLKPLDKHMGVGKDARTKATTIPPEDIGHGSAKEKRTKRTKSKESLKRIDANDAEAAEANITKPNERKDSTDSDKTKEKRKKPVQDKLKSSQKDTNLKLQPLEIKYSKETAAKQFHADAKTKQQHSPSDTSQTSNEESPELRRSARSPVKPKRFLDNPFYDQLKQPTRKGASAKKAQSKKTLELYGTDDESANDANSSSGCNNAPTSSKKQKRKRDNSREYAKERHRMDQWLDKTLKLGNRITSPFPKKTIRKDTPTKSSTSTMMPLPYVSLTKEEKKERMDKEKIQIERNRELNRMLEKMAGPPPEKVETLSLMDMSKSEILSTFEDHKPVLDEIFRTTNTKLNVNSYKGIDHMLVIGLVQHKIQLQMLHKLSDFYEENDGGTSTHTELFANAMMPEWIINIFMDKYCLTRDEAIKQIKAQEVYKIHTNSHLDDTALLFN